MSKWPFVKLGTLADFKNGLNFSRANWGRGLKVIGVADFQDYIYPKYEEIEEINPNGVVRQADYLEEGDILFVRSNGNRELIGRSLFISKLPERMSHSGFTIRVRFKSDKVFRRFYLQLFKSSLIRAVLSAYGGGTNINNLNQQILAKLDVPLPPLVTQQKIAAVLSAYDELIENYKRRIALLEKLAEEVYREWFVRMRFPGHEKVKQVKGIPENWEPLTLDDICTIKGGKRLPLGHNLVDQKTDHPYIKSRDIKGGAINENELQFVEDSTFQTIKRYIVNEGDICITIVANIGDVGIVPASLDGASLTENAVKLVGLKRGVSSLFLGYTLLMPHYKEYMQLLAAGAAQSKLGIYKIKAIKLWIPPPELMKKFDAQIVPLRKQVHLLEKAIANAQASRDLLLPRLISGNLSVENVDIRFPPGMSEELNAELATANA